MISRPCKHRNKEIEFSSKFVLGLDRFPSVECLVLTVGVDLHDFF